MKEPRFELTIAYDIPDSGMYEHDILIEKLIGESAKVTSFGSVMFTSRIISYKFPSEVELNMAINQLLDNKIFRLMDNKGWITEKRNDGRFIN